MDKWINRLSNSAVIAIAIAAVFVAVQRFTGRSTAASRTTAYTVGDQLDLSPLSLNHRALLVVTRSGCHFCTESMPFYKSISAIAVIWIALGEDAATNRRYLENHGIRPDNVVTTELLGLSKVHSTPQLLLVDSSGRIVQMWVGKVDEDKQAEVLAALKGVKE